MKHPLYFYTSFILLLFQLSPLTFAQSNKKTQALEKANHAIELVDAGKFEEGIKLLQEAEKLDPQNINYPYEIGYAYYSQSNYQQAVKIIQPLLKHPHVHAKVYQLLGNAYDNMEQGDKASITYEEGLKKFPKAGNLYLEMGVLHMMKKDYENALAYYEKGIEVDPSFASNYYWATQIYAISSQKIWSMIYGELFMNLERHSERTAEIGKLLYANYTKCITITSDTSITLAFSQNSSIDIKTMKLPFALAAYEPTLLMSIVNEKKIDLNSLNRIRTNFVDTYFKNGTDKKYPNVLFDFQKKIADAGLLEAYNYWVLSKGDENEYSKWHGSHQILWDNFVKWFNQNKLQLSNEYKFYREQY
ncbi:MAG: hypothetical protein JWO58_2306 [Chitinophagaceae bacterium]|nr:hypothetical protein [Chitinophagaceae bacterium]